MTYAVLIKLFSCDSIKFSLPGHKAHGDLVMLPIEILSASDPFLLRARETLNINKFKTEKRLGVSEIEHGLNLDQGQW